MKSLLQLEQVALLAACYLTTLYLDYSWWLFFALLLLPDISMVGYAINNKLGAALYNFVHHQGIAIAVVGAGWYLGYPFLLLTGIVLLGHSAMDRVFGYGLKYNTSFNDTHLGKIGKQVN